MYAFRVSTVCSYAKEQTVSLKRDITVRLSGLHKMLQISFKSSTHKEPPPTSTCMLIITTIIIIMMVIKKTSYRSQALFRTSKDRPAAIAVAALPMMTNGLDNVKRSV